MNVLEHKVTSVDTMQSLAATYLGDASRWRDIVDFNNLDYPYISSDPNFQTATYASGNVTAVRAYSTSSLPIPKGTIFAVPQQDGYPSRHYVTVIDYTMNPGDVTAVIPVQCTVAGLWGDVTEGAISTIVTADPTLKQAFSAIANMSPISNGNILNVKLLGDSVLIPVDDSWDGTATYSTLDDFYNAQFGEDLALGDDGDLVFDGYGSVGSVAGISNLAQACRDRITTPNLSLVYHPEYGSLLDSMVANPGAPYNKKLISLGIIETLLADDRIDHVNVVGLDQQGTQLNVVIDVYPIQGSEAVRVPFIVPNLAA